MKLGALLKRPRPELPGLAGIARVDRNTEALLRRVRRGEIAVLDQIDLDRSTADALIEAHVGGVINASPSISGRFPNLGPEALVSAGVVLVDAVGAEAVRAIKDGSRIRVHDGVVYLGETEVCRGVAQTTDTVADAMVGAKAGMTHQLEAFSANTTEFMRRERALLLDGVGVPDVEVEIRGRQVLVVAGGAGTPAELAKLRHYIGEYRPLLVGVGAGADALWNVGLKPDLIVGDPAEISNEALTSGADVVVPAFADGHAPGLHRVQDLGAGAVTFPGSANPEDLALLLVHHHGAELIVTVGLSASMAEFLDRGRSGSNASTFLTRLRLGADVVDSRALLTLYRHQVSFGAIALLIGAVLVALLAALLVSDAGPALWTWVVSVWNSVIGTVGRWFS
ncbi:MAG: thiamine pyrophosphokinase [Pseudonocardiales bacterium]|nr:thiamine pyrophosphokinase [Pseudonocardiales bacterium]